MDTHDVRLMKGAGMDDCFDVMISEDALHDCYVGHRTDDVRGGSGRNVEANHDMTSPEPRSQKPAQPALTSQLEERASCLLGFLVERKSPIPNEPNVGKLPEFAVYWLMLGGGFPWL